MNDTILMKFAKYCVSYSINKKCPFENKVLKQYIARVNNYGSSTYQRIENRRQQITAENKRIQDQLNHQHSFTLSRSGNSSWICPQCRSSTIVQCEGSRLWRKCADCNCMIQIVD